MFIFPLPGVGGCLVAAASKSISDHAGYTRWDWLKTFVPFVRVCEKYDLRRQLARMDAFRSFIPFSQNISGIWVQLFEIPTQAAVRLQLWFFFKWRCLPVK